MALQKYRTVSNFSRNVSQGRGFGEQNRNLSGDKSTYMVVEGRAPLEIVREGVKYPFSNFC